MYQHITGPGYEAIVDEGMIYRRIGEEEEITFRENGKGRNLSRVYAKLTGTEKAAPIATKETAISKIKVCMKIIARKIKNVKEKM